MCECPRASAAKVQGGLLCPQRRLTRATAACCVVLPAQRDPQWPPLGPMPPHTCPGAGDFPEGTPSYLLARGPPSVLRAGPRTGPVPPRSGFPAAPALLRGQRGSMTPPALPRGWFPGVVGEDVLFPQRGLTWAHLQRRSAGGARPGRVSTRSRIFARVREPRPELRWALGFPDSYLGPDPGAPTHARGAQPPRVFLVCVCGGSTHRPHPTAAAREGVFQGGSACRADKLGPK